MKKGQIYIYFGQTHDKLSQSHIQILCWLSGLISLRCPIPVCEITGSSIASTFHLL